MKLQTEPNHILLNYPYLALLVFSACMLVPVSIDIFIAGLPAMQLHFPNHSITLVMGMSLLGLTLSQLVYGPLLDYFGRKPVILLGVIIYTLASLVIVFSNTFEILLTGRFLQAFGGSASVVGVISVIKDIYPKEQLVAKIGLVMAMIGISPVIAPFIGGIVDSIWGWRGSFAVLCAMGVAYIIIVTFLLTETIPYRNKDAIKISTILNCYVVLLRSSPYRIYCLISGLTYCILFSYLNISAFIIINQLGYRMISYGAIVAANALIIVIMAIYAPIMAKKASINYGIIIGLVLIVVGGIVMIIINYNLVPNIISFMLPVFIVTSGAGIIRPLANGGAMSVAPPGATGFAAACFNFISFGSGALVSIFSLYWVHNVLEFGVFIMFFGTLALLLMSFIILKTYRCSN